MNVDRLYISGVLKWSFSFLYQQVKVLFAGQDIDKSPYTVNVAKDMGDPSKVHARGPGLDATGNVANKPTYFDIYTAGEIGKFKHFTYWYVDIWPTGMWSDERLAVF